jgi:hypothetical protein
MPTPLRSGPSIIIYGGQTFVAKSDIDLSQDTSTFAVESSLGGTLEDRVQQIEHKVSCTLDGRVLAPQLAVIYSALNNRVGAFLHQGNTPLVIIQDTGGPMASRRTYHNAEITQVPGLKLSSRATIHEAMTWTCLHRTDMEVGDEDSLYTDDEVAWPGVPGYSPADILTQCYHASWGAAPWAAFYGRDGISVSFDFSISPIQDDCRGLAGYQVQDVQAEATLIPVGPSPEQVSAALVHQGAGARLGRSLSSADQDLTISGEGLHIILRRAGITKAKAMLGLKTLREGEATWVAGRRMAAGLMQPLVYVGTAAPQP